MMKRMMRNMRRIKSIKMTQIKMILIFSLLMINFLMTQPNLFPESLNEIMVISAMAMRKRNPINK
jgi:hypothetical protein